MNVRVPCPSRHHYHCTRCEAEWDACGAMHPVNGTTLPTCKHCGGQVEVVRCDRGLCDNTGFVQVPFAERAVTP